MPMQTLMNIKEEAGNMKRRRLLSILLSLCMVVALMPQTASAAGASDSTPSVSAYATKNQLMDGTFAPDSSGTAVNIGKLAFGKNSEGDPLEWYILGRDSGVSGDNTIIFAAGPIVKGQVFEDDYENNKGYDSGWGCTYPESRNITVVHPNHYGASDVRSVLNSIAGDTGYFTLAQQNLMNKTLVKSSDTYNAESYTTEDKLYLLKGDFDAKVIYAGTDNSTAIARESYWSKAASAFWLRSTLIFNGDASLVLSVTPNDKVNADMLNNKLAVCPASNLDLSDVLFASSAKTAGSEPVYGTVSSGDAMTLRLDGSEKNPGTVTYNEKENCITAVTGSSEGGISLNVQGKNGTSDWYYSIPVKGTETVTMSEIRSALGLPSDISWAECRIWLETADEDGMIYAVNMSEGEYDKIKKEQAITAVRSIKTTVTLTTGNIKRGIKVNVKIPALKKADKTGIIIYRSLKKNSGYAVYKKVKTSGASYTITNTLNVKGSRLVKGKRYYYKARVYKVIDGKPYYGPMSDVKYMKAK